MASELKKQMHDWGILKSEFSLIAQWIECPPVVWEVMGLIPVRDSLRFFLSHAHVLLISSLFTFHY